MPDVVIVGARVAGAATALLLARLGHEVLVLDRASMPSDTLSTHQIARTGVLALRRWGVLDAVVASGTPLLRDITFHADSSVTRPIKDKFGLDFLVSPRRYVLDTLLGEAAVAAGATIRTGVAVAGVHLDDTGRATGVFGHDRLGSRVDVSARFVVGADGLGSRVARSVGAPLVVDRGLGGFTRYAYYADLPTSGIEMYTTERCLAGIFPTHGGEACVWLCGPRSRPAWSFDAQLRASVPALAERLPAARRTSPVRSMLRAPNHVRRAHGPGWALVGDAGYHRDPVSAHGISDAFRDAELLAVALDAALRGSPTALAHYEAARAAALADIFELTCALSAYPPVPEFVELMGQLGAAIDVESANLAGRPVPALVPAQSTKEI
jgi:2-polyprenyl-6-methoxyphenol hydroxylase-like FAD-dependent oxidoreductase